MKTYKVTFTEKLQMEVEQEATSRYEAERLVERQWKDGDHILDADHFTGVTFKAETPERNRGDSR